VAVSVLATRAARRTAARSAMLGSVAVLAVAAVVIGLTHDVAVLAGAYCALVGATVFYTVHWRTYRQEIVPPDQLGRVSAACRSIAYSGIVVGTLVIGVLQDAGAGTGPLFVGGGLLCLAGTAAVATTGRRGRPAPPGTQRSRVSSTVTPSDSAAGPE